MIGILLAVVLLSPQTQTDPIKVKCVLVNLSPIRLACDDTQKSELEMSFDEWPDIWHSQHLTGSYNAEIRDGKLYAVETFDEPGRNDRIRANTLKEQRRWRIPPTQVSGKP